MPPTPSAPMVDGASKSALHQLLHSLNLPLPQYETTVHLSYSVNIILPDGLRDVLGQGDTKQRQTAELLEMLRKNKGVFKGRPAKEKRDAVRRSVDAVMRVLAVWAAECKVREVQKREWRIEKRERKRALRKKGKNKTRAEVEAEVEVEVARGDGEENGGGDGTGETVD